MKKRMLLLRSIAGMMVASLFVMCTKESLKVAEPVSLVTNTIDTLIDTNSLSTRSLQALKVFTYTVKASDWLVDGSRFPAGAIIYIPAGRRGALLFKNLKGTAAKPIIITNKGGLVSILTSNIASYAFKTQNCQHFKIRGTGAEGIRYGFNISGGNIGMTLDDLSSDFEVNNVEVHNSGFAGIMAKTDPSCDVATQRGHFTMRNVILHGNYVHNTGGEGFYVGNSFYASGRSLPCGNVLPHDVDNVRIYSNITEATGCEGIQVGSAIVDCKVFHNTVRSPGVSPFASGQNNGIQIGEGTGGMCYDNYVTNAPGNGIIVLGLGDNVVYNNIIVNSGANGIFADSRYTPGRNFQFINNTIINSGANGIKLNSERIPMNTVINNVIVGSKSGTAINRMSRSVKLTALNNFESNNVASCKFVNYQAGDFHLLRSSPLINVGANILSYDIITDYFGQPRRAGNKYDVGATEY
jgi:hypothetical protein